MELHKDSIERDIIASICTYPKFYSEIRGELNSDNWTPVNVGILSAIQECADRGLEITLENVAELAKVSIGHLPLVSESKLSLGILTRLHAEAVIGEKLLRVARDITPEAEVFDSLSRVQGVVDECQVVLHSFGRKTKPTLLQMYEDYIRAFIGKQIVRYATGFPTLDKCLRGGFDQGGYVLIGGVPKIGKTSLMIGIALTQLVADIKTGFIEAEMVPNEIFIRFQSIMSQKKIHDLERGGNGWEKDLDMFKSLMLEFPIEFSFPTERSNQSLASEVSRLADKGCKVIYVDYLQVFAAKRGSAKDEFSEIKKTSELLRSLSLRYKVCIVAASSLNREEEFYGSTGLLHDASVAIKLIPHADRPDIVYDPVLGIYRDITLDLLAARNALTGAFTLRYWLETQRFVELEENRYEPARTARNPSESSPFIED